MFETEENTEIFNGLKQSTNLMLFHFVTYLHFLKNAITTVEINLLVPQQILLLLKL